MRTIRVLAPSPAFCKTPLKERRLKNVALNLCKISQLDEQSGED
jgi:hypothetical protein